MAKHEFEFSVEYIFQPSADAEERLARAYDLILELMLVVTQNPEEDAVGAFPNAADAGDLIHSRRNQTASQSGAIHDRN